MGIDTREGKSRDGLLDRETVNTFEANLRGELIQPGDDRYDEARSLYNGMIDKRPALIARCVDAADVQAAVNFAREQNLLVAVRGGGHNGAGLGSCDGGLVIDLSEMKGIRVNSSVGTVRVEGGCTWGDVDHAAHPYGLAVPTGFLSSTGVGGLTLGGGLGYLTRRYGLTIDNLLEVDMVLADGQFITANPVQNNDLFWAVRGGGGNFGVVTSFLFQGHPVKTVYGGPMFWEMDHAREVMCYWRDLILNGPEEINGWFGFHTVPPVDMFPSEHHMKKMACQCKVEMSPKFAK
jgi:FAD/FMN-containing dehydrogenase